MPREQVGALKVGQASRLPLGAEDSQQTTLADVG